MIENPKVASLLKDISQREGIKDYLMVIYGQFNIEIIVSAISLIERKLIFDKFPTNIITKTKMICTEMLQNITKHQEPHETVLPYFIIGTNGKALSILSGNVVTEKAKGLIESKLEEYISIDNGVLRGYYVGAYKNSVVSENGGAGLGLLEIVYRANQNVKYSMDSISNGCFSYNLEVTINQAQTA